VRKIPAYARRAPCDAVVGVNTAERRSAAHRTALHRRPPVRVADPERRLTGASAPARRRSAYLAPPPPTRPRREALARAEVIAVPRGEWGSISARFADPRGARPRFHRGGGITVSRRGGRSTASRSRSRRSSPARAGRILGRKSTCATLRPSRRRFVLGNERHDRMQLSGRLTGDAACIAGSDPSPRSRGYLFARRWKAALGREVVVVELPAVMTR
jgi:hypothetical protein